MLSLILKERVSHKRLHDQVIWKFFSYFFFLTLGFSMRKPAKKGSDKREREKFDCVEHRGCQKNGRTVLKRKTWDFRWLNEINLFKLLSHLETGNQRNCNIICAMFSLYLEFTREFESNIGDGGERPLWKSDLTRRYLNHTTFHSV